MLGVGLNERCFKKMSRSVSHQDSVACFFAQYAQTVSRFSFRQFGILQNTGRKKDGLFHEEIGLSFLYLVP
jgi:hypothetical protein